MENRYETMATALGMTITESHKSFAGMQVFEAKMELDRGTITLYCGDNGTARIDKPNGTHKWYYEKSTGQLRAAIKQVIDFWK